jgi:hypothetical protein
MAGISISAVRASKILSKPASVNGSATENQDPENRVLRVFETVRST